ncbi:MAG: hypothetical protein E7449_00435 [Ruminococcaceae bacterium]|nr:hypothetical protein [Oscillospiraceae bacterium]
MRVRFFALVLVLCIFFSFAAQADVIWEPEDSFYRSHSKECSYYARSRIVNSPEGGLAVYVSPKSSSVVGTVENGTALHVQFTYDNEAWGYVETPEGDGWMPLADTVLKYDHVSFTEEYSEAFFEDEAVVKAMLESLTDEDLIYDYAYPGSGPTKSYIPAEYVLSDEWFSLQSLFEDEEGRIWGHVGYFMGRRGWICVSDPTNSELPDAGRQQLELYPVKVIDVPNTMDTGTLAAVLVGGVAVLSGGLLAVLRGKKTKEV